VRDRTLPTREATRIREQQLRTLMSVDELVDDVFEKMKELGETRDLIAFYLSDNGFMWGEHGLTGNRFGKRYPYTESVMIPFLVRGLPAGSMDENSIVGTIDIAPTVLEAAGITPDPEYPIDGRSLVTGRARDHILLEYWNESGIPSWASTRTSTYQFVEYYSSDGQVIAREYYDLVDDPLQLYNLLGDIDPTNDPDVELLEQQLARDRSCTGTACP
jgi:arylsulfatase A-like enzyme